MPRRWRSVKEDEAEAPTQELNGRNGTKRNRLAAVIRGGTIVVDRKQEEPKTKRTSNARSHDSFVDTENQGQGEDADISPQEENDLPQSAETDPRAKSRAWDATRRRWKRRKYDLRGEADVGRVVQQRVRLATRASVQTNNSTEENMNATRTRNNNDGGFVLYQDDQAKVLDTLRRSASAVIVPEVPSSSAILPMEEPWELGVAPPWEKSRPRRRPSKAATSTQPTSQHSSDLLYTKRGWSTAEFSRRQRQRQPPTTVPAAAPWPLHHDAPRPHSAGSGLTSRTSLLPRRQLLRAIARHLVGGGGAKDSTTHHAAITTLWKLCGTKETPPLRLLWTTQSILLEELSRRNGLNALARLESGTTPVPTLLAPEQDVGFPLLSARRTGGKGGAHEIRKPSSSTLEWVTPETLYVPLPGTVPPAIADPSATGKSFVFGPVDRFAQVLHASGRIDPAISNLSLAAILQQMAASDASLTSHWQSQLSSILHAMLQYNQNNVYKRLTQKFRNPDLEVPLAFFYRTVRQYCAMVVAGLVRPADDLLQAVETAGPRNGMQEEEDNCKVRLVAMVDHLWDFLEKHIRHNGLRLFSDLHIFHGTLRVGKMLPESGIAILAQPLDQQRSRTPISTFRQLLEHLEQRRCLSEKQSTYFDRTVINVGELEYAFFRASGTFAQCTERESTSVEYHGWYLGALASSLLLCSGQIIGNRRSSGESRRQLPKFPEMRREAARAFRALAHLAQDQQSQLAHQTMVSFLVWSQVLSLLIGRSDDTEICDNLRGLHRYHSTQWLLQENTKAALATASSGLYDCSELEVLARALEQNPSDIRCWRSFVATLGPFIAPDGSAMRSAPGWGVDRVDWWDTCLLQPVLEKSNRETTKRSKRSNSTAGLSSDDTDEIYSRMVSCLKSIEPIRLDSTSPSSIENTDQSPTLNGDSPSLDWLDGFISSLDNESDQVADPCLTKNGEDLFSFPIKEHKASPIEHQIAPLPLQTLLSGHDERQFEIIGYKALILCHLYSATHSYVMAHLQHLFRSAEASWLTYRNDEFHQAPPNIYTYLTAPPKSIAQGSLTFEESSSNRNAWLTLCWLYRMGLDVTQIEI